MSSPDQSLDPNRTVDHVAHSPQPAMAHVSQSDRPTDVAGSFVPPTPANAPSITGYHIIAEIAKGGMGCVYAGRDLTLDRNVAIKTLLPGANAERFVSEAKIMGQLQHPGIPAVHELGELADGRPFLAMKLVKGHTLGELLNERTEPSQQRGWFIAIFEQVCHAVGYAHAHNIIHRDLKPGNVMVGAHGEVQVMDWGLAKVLGPGRDQQERQRADETGEPEELPATVASPTAIGTPEHGDPATRTGSVLGTPAYMPPEQAAGEIHKLDARSDVFGLGAILCRMLTGRPPYESKDEYERRVKAVRGGLQEAFARLETCGAEPELIGLCKRCLAFRQEDRPVNGEAVAREVAQIRQAAEERARRAEVERAAALVREAEGRKRRRIWMGLAATLLVGLAASLALAAWAVRAERIALAERDAKEAALIAQTQAKLEADKEREKALAAAEQERAARLDEERERKFAQAISSFVKEDFLALTSVEGQGRFGGEGLDRNATLLDLLNRAAEKLSARKDLDPRIDAELCWIVGVNYRGAGEAAKGLPFLERAVQLRQRVLGADHEETLNAMNSLAVAYTAAGKFELALPLLEETVKLETSKLGPDHPCTLMSVNNLASGYQDAGKLNKALPLYQETLRLRKAKLGPSHPDTLQSMNNLASAYGASGKLELALPLWEETLKLIKAKLGADHPNTLRTMNNLAAGYQRAGKLELALPLLEETLRLKKARLGADHPDTLRSMNNLASGYDDAGKLALALPLWEETLRLSKAKLGPDHPDTLQSMNNLAFGYQAAGKLELALPLYEETLKLRKVKLGPDHPDTLQSMNNLAFGYQAAGKLDLAMPLFEEAAEGIEKRQFQHEHAGRIVGNLIDCHERLGQFGQAEMWRHKWAAVVRERAGADSPDYAGELAALGLNLLQQKKWADAEVVLRECLTIRKQQQPDAWTTFNTLSMLGGAILGQANSTSDPREKAQRLAEAEPLLIKGYEGMKEREQTIPPPGPARLPEALDRLIELYVSLDKPDQLTKFQQLRLQYPAARAVK